MNKSVQVMDKFEYFLQNHDISIVRSFHPYFENAFFKMLRVGGKRFRPKLLLSIVYAKKEDILIEAFNAALALEVLHTYSLIHDDLPIMDNASLRRGENTLHVQYNDTIATLVGDALNTYAFYLITQSNLDDLVKVRLVNSLSFNSVKMVLGQALDCHFENEKLKKDKLDFIHKNKTARLIASALEMGAIISKLPDSEVQNLYDFGILLGLFFQIRDDILDKTKSTFEAGKPTNNDVNKNSYVNLLGLESAILEKNNLENLINARINDMQPCISDSLKFVFRDLLNIG